MTIKFPCTLQFSDSGKTIQITHRNGSVLANILAEDGEFLLAVKQAHYRRQIDWDMKIQARQNGQDKPWTDIDPNVQPFIGVVLNSDNSEINWTLEKETLEGGTMGGTAD
jgi:hypothetical protein